MMSHLDSTTYAPVDETFPAAAIRYFNDWMDQIGEKFDTKPLDIFAVGVQWQKKFGAPAAPAVPQGYALISVDALRAWGKLDEVKAACVYPTTPAAPSQPAVPQGWRITRIDSENAVVINGPIGGCVAVKDADIARTIPESILYELACALLAIPSQEPGTLTDGLIEKGAMTGMVDAQIDDIIAALREKEQV